MDPREKSFRILKNFEPEDKTPIIDLILKETPRDSAGKAAFGFALGYVFGQMFEVDDKEAISQVKELHKRVLRNSHLLKSLKTRLRKAGSKI